MYIRHTKMRIYIYVANFDIAHLDHLHVEKIDNTSSPSHKGIQMITKSTSSLVLLLPTCIATVAPLQAHAVQKGTLDKIAASRTITLGVRDSSPPFSYLDDKQSYIGYSIDLCMKVVSAVQKQLGASSLSVKMQPVTSSTRIPLLANGTIDLECGSTTNNEDRQKQVSFAPTTFVTSNRLLSKKTANIKTLADLKGKTLVATAGTTNIKQVTQLNADKSLGINILASKDIGEGFLMVETGRAVAYSLDDVVLAALAANSKSPDDYRISAEAMSFEPYGIVLRKDDPEFKKAVDAAITAVFRSGEINRIYAKWFQAAIPPKGINMNWPMTPQLQKAIAHPTDSADPEVYK
ncbi:periplasmic component of amino acid ABC-type transporter/signal transduction system [Herbaspirillum sp. CF444]|nr:periplasmic component of amino acid ABC-type transporter/signal transduction system [Herbaspirillum sp. CF444]